MKPAVRTALIIGLVIVLVAVIAALTVRQGMKKSAPSPVTLSDDARTDAERIIRARINTLSPTPPTLGSRFAVDSIEWDAWGRATVRYGDGESMLQGIATVQTGSGHVKIESFIPQR